MRLDDVNDRFNLNLAAQETDTIGGYVLEELGKIPRVGDVIRAPGASIKVEEMAQRKIKTVRLIIDPRPVEAEAQD